MFEVLNVFYSIHYNFAILSILLAITVIWLLTKKNYKWTIIFLVVLVAFNTAIFKRTDGKSWTISLESAKDSSQTEVVSKKYTFSAAKNWTITDSKGEVHHWCWVEDWGAKISSMDLVAVIWGENKSKKMVQASEERLEGNVGD